MKQLILPIAIVACSFYTGKSQDIHFSQFDMAPLILNPSLTGVFNGDQRASLNYKDQWTGFGSGYKTYSFSGDVKLMKKKWNSTCLGLGLNVFKDIAGDAQLSDTKALLSISGIMDISNEQQISAGIQGGIVQNRLDPSAAMWDDQYVNGAYNAGVSTQEQINHEALFYADAALGISWSYTKNQSTISSYDATKVVVGMAIHHLNKPDYSYTLSGSELPLYSKFIFHANSNIGIKNTRFTIKPGVMAAFQGPSKEILAGTLLRYRLKEASRFTGLLKEQAISLGGHYRFNDAFVPSLWYEAGNLALCISYDVNVSSLKEASNMRGGMEVALRFINPSPFRYKKKSFTPML